MIDQTGTDLYLQLLRPSERRRPTVRVANERLLRPSERRRPTVRVANERRR